ncbi:Energy-coupling factor transporter transmembrane protein EcfT [Paenibacillus solanacearum]|uniref:Energy-coupling factor transporter transmembrane protein EcfT n=1 Tax=Paenibacillus solanacearum TaxID=2048548 RepID=A0A916JUT5_9BACL|nr:cobalt ECF transporter T component CbiQ [Paenibacillus solanacearum]CAG7604192.1 Energy-coupling factor transporter transmembrane protein EcfT [Paenibacillus solanacearum]
MTAMLSHPPVRIVTALLMIMLSVSMKHTETLFIMLLFTLLLVLYCKVPFRQLRRRLRLALPFIVFSFVFFSLYEQGDVMRLAGVTLSVDGLHKALTYSLRLVVTLHVLTLLFHRLSSSEFFQALVKLKVPGIFVELILFTLRFMDVIRTEALHMLQALKSRGFRTGRFFSLSQYAVLSKLLGSLLLRSLQRSERIYMGMMSRSYRGIPPQRHTAPLLRSDVAIAFLWLVPVVAAFIYDIR